jgi:gamma-F420-2:alpha-L-glutamate ligase
MERKYGWLIYNGSLLSSKFMEIHNWYKQTAAEKGIILELIKNTEIYSVIEQNQTFIRAENRPVKPDFILFLDKDVRLAKQLEQLGYRLFNKASVIETCDDKIMTFQALANQSVKLPKTIFSPMVFFESPETDHSFIDFLERELSYPMVVKEAFGSFGEQVYLVKSRGELQKKRRELLLRPHLYQEFIQSSKGRDVRIHVVGDKVVASMLRTSENDFRANVTNGGKMHEYKPPKEFEELAIRTSRIIGADFTGVDLLFGEEGEPILCEINSNAHIKNIYDCTGIDVTEHIFEYILRKVWHV